MALTSSLPQLSAFGNEATLQLLMHQNKRFVDVRDNFSLLSGYGLLIILRVRTLNSVMSN